MLLLAVAACNSNNNNNSGNSGNNNSGNVQKQDPFGKYDPPITVTAVRRMETDLKFEPGNPDRDTMTNNIWYNTYKDKLGVIIDWLWVIEDSEYDTKWNVTIASNDVPDIAVVFASTYLLLREGGYIEDMTDLFAAYASDDYKLANEMDYGFAMNGTSYGGRLMGLPFTGQFVEATPILFVRQDWMDTLGKTAPKTIDELVDLARAFKNAQFGGSGSYGLAMNKQILLGLCDITGFANGFGAYFLLWQDNGSGHMEFSNVQPEWRTALLALQSMYKEGLISQEAPVSEWTKAMEDIAQNKVGIAYGAFAMPLAALTANTMANPEAEWAILPCPSVDGSPTKVQSLQSSLETFIFVKKGMVHPEAAVKICNQNFENRKDAAYGNVDGYAHHKYGFACDLQKPGYLIDIHAKISEAVRTGDITEIENTPGAQENYDAVMAGLNGDRGNNFWMILGPAPSTFSIMKEQAENKNYLVNEFRGIRTPSMVENFQILVNELNAAMMQVITGEDISVFDKAVEDWYANGGDLMTKEVNEWYDANK